MKINKLLEMPQVINSLNPFEIDELVEFISQNSSKSEFICRHFILDVRVIKSPGFEIFYAIDSNGKVVYASKVRKIEQNQKLIPQGYAGRQVLIKKFSSSSTFRISSFIFWEVIFPRYHVIVSDSQQTLDGKSFWSYRLMEAIERGFVVRLMDTNTNQIKVISTVEELHELTDGNSVWNSGSWFTRIILCISKD